MRMISISNIIIDFVFPFTFKPLACVLNGEIDYHHNLSFDNELIPT